jgi:hypothetical protein
MEHVIEIANFARSETPEMPAALSRVEGIWMVM